MLLAWVVSTGFNAMRRAIEPLRAAATRAARKLVHDVLTGRLLVPRLGVCQHVDPLGVRVSRVPEMARAHRGNRLTVAAITSGSGRMRSGARGATAVGLSS